MIEPKTTPTCYECSELITSDNMTEQADESFTESGQMCASCLVCCSGVEPWRVESGDFAPIPADLLSEHDNYCLFIDDVFEQCTDVYEFDVFDSRLVA